MRFRYPVALNVNLPLRSVKSKPVSKSVFVSGWMPGSPATRPNLVPSEPRYPRSESALNFTP